MKLFQRLETAFEEAHLHGAADHVRSFLMRFPVFMKPQLAWRETCNMEQRRGFAILQREIYLKEEVKARLEKSNDQKLTAEESTQLEKWEKELEELDLLYWLHTRAMHKINLEKPKGPWVRDWDSKCRREASPSGGHGQIELPLAERNQWRSNSVRRRPAIAGSRQRELCAGRGGCCARECGCCEKYLNTPRELVKGHCTIECGCCIRDRGFRRTPNQGLEKSGLNGTVNALPWDARL